MQKVVILGVETRQTKDKKNDYHMLHVGADIKEGYGFKPMSFKLNSDEFEDFKEQAYGNEVDISYEVVQDLKGNFKFILKTYKF